MAAACASAVIDTLVRGGVLAEAQATALYLDRGLESMAQRLGPEHVVEVRGTGHLRAVELKQPAANVIDRCREAGVLVISAGANNVRLAPALIISPDQVEEGLSVLESAIAAGND